MQLHTVADRGHTKFPHAEAHVLIVSCFAPAGVIRACQIRRSTKQLWHTLSYRSNGRLRRLAGFQINGIRLLCLGKGVDGLLPATG